MGWNVIASRTDMTGSGRNFVRLEVWFRAVKDASMNLIYNTNKETTFTLLFSSPIDTSKKCRIRMVWHYGNSTTYTDLGIISTFVTFKEAPLSVNNDYPRNIYLEQYTPVPPSTPSSISVTPSIVKEGETISISWGTGSNATKYYLQRSINGGSYADIYNGTTRSYSDTALASWNTVSYRVRAYNSDGYSSYRTSATITIQHFPEFQMRVNGSLKTSDNGWVRVNGVLREIDSIKVRAGGILKEV